MRRGSLPVLLLLLSGAIASPAHSQDAPRVLLWFEGYLEDAGGLPVTGEQEMSFAIYAAPEGGQPLWIEPADGVQSITVDDGHFGLYLGALTPLTVDLFAAGPRYLSLVVEGVEMGARSEIGGTPRALIAERAVRAEVCDQASSLAPNSVDSSGIADGTIASADIGPLTTLTVNDISSVAGTNLALTAAGAAGTRISLVSPGGVNVGGAAADATAFNVASGNAVFAGEIAALSGRFDGDLEVDGNLGVGGVQVIAGGNISVGGLEVIAADGSCTPTAINMPSGSTISIDGTEILLASGALTPTVLNVRAGGNIAIGGVTVVDSAGKLTPSSIDVKANGTLRMNGVTLVDATTKLTPSSIDVKANGTIGMNGVTLVDATSKLTPSSIDVKTNGTIGVNGVPVVNAAGESVPVKLIVKAGGNIAIGGSEVIDATGHWKGAPIDAASVVGSVGDASTFDGHSLDDFIVLSLPDASTKLSDLLGQVSVNAATLGTKAPTHYVTYTNAGYEAAAKAPDQVLEWLKTLQPGATPVPGLNADRLDNHEATDFLLAAAQCVDSDKLDGKHAVDFLGATAKAADADKLDGLDSTEFARAAGGKAVDADRLDGLHADAFLGVGAKAADADRLDGLDSTQFLRADVSATSTAGLTLNTAANGSADIDVKSGSPISSSLHPNCTNASAWACVGSQYFTSNNYYGMTDSSVITLGEAGNTVTVPGNLTIAGAFVAQGYDPGTGGQSFQSVTVTGTKADGLTALQVNNLPGAAGDIDVRSGDTSNLHPICATANTSCVGSQYFTSNLYYGSTAAGTIALGETTNTVNVPGTVNLGTGGATPKAVTVAGPMTTAGLLTASGAMVTIGQLTATGGVTTQTISSTSALSLSAAANGAINLTTQATGAITLTTQNQPLNLNLGGGKVTLGGPPTGGITSTGAYTIATGAGDLTLSPVANIVTARPFNPTGLITAGGGLVSSVSNSFGPASFSGAISANGGLTSTGAYTIATGAGDLTLVPVGNIVTARQITAVTAGLQGPTSTKAMCSAANVGTMYYHSASQSLCVCTAAAASRCIATTAAGL